YTLCTTYDSVAAATATLAKATTLILDCEARDIARTTGVLSLISIADAETLNVFLIDALALHDPTHPSLRAFLELLSSEDVIKVMWDGRSDAVELRETYGVTLRGVLDLQLVEVVSRESVRGETAEYRRARFEAGYFRGVHDVFPAPGKYEGVFQILGMATCLKMRGIPDSKDASVVAMHRSMGSEMWLRRPLPEKLLAYAAHDITLVAKLLASFVRGRWISAENQSELLAQSARYVRTLASRRVKELHDRRSLGLFVGLDVLSDPEDCEGRDSERHVCEGCEQTLTLRCFATSTGRAGGGEKRMTFCRLCALLAQ
ncbi:ribonuclease H-like domain-containing protein, partial [Daedaleopsis nitida]